MAFAGVQVAVSSTPAELTAADTDGREGQSVGITTCDVDLYLGATSSVSSSTGAKLPAGTPFSADVAAGDHIFMVTASGSGTAHVVRTGV